MHYDKLEMGLLGQFLHNIFGISGFLHLKRRTSAYNGRKL